jgi:hypothetical protein
MDKNLKRWIRSSAESFLAGFLVAVSLQLDTISNVETFTTSVVAGLFYAGVRGGIKGLAEMLVKKKD